MKDFFSRVPNIKFEMFGGLHILLMLITLIGVILLFIFRDKLKNFKYKEQVRSVIAVVLTLNMIIFYLSLFITKDFKTRDDLPLHLCFITNFFMIYILFKGDKKLYKLIYFFTFIGPLPAMIWSDIPTSYDRFIFYQFIISHHIMFLSSIYLLTVLDYKVEKKYILKAIIVGAIYVVIMAIFNSIVGSNYVMLTSLPQNVKDMYPFTNILPPFIWLASVGILSIYISYIPAYIINKKDKKLKE